MIRNILFDMGNVLMHWDPALFIRRLGYTGEDALCLEREVYRSVEWVMLDRGSIEDGEAIARIRARLPERLRPPVEDLVSHWDSEPLPMDGMLELAEALEQAGYGLYLLTNASRRHRVYWDKFPVSRFFPRPRIMLSADWRVIKPEAAFYERAFSLLRLNPAECLFVDDNAANIEAGMRLGLDGVVFFGDAAHLRRQMREKGVEVTV